MSTNGRWLALHVHHGGDLTRLLVDGLAPVAATLEQQCAVVLWHAVRYWNAGPHIRLRALPRTPEDAHVVCERLINAAQQYLLEHPSAPADAAEYERIAAAMRKLQRAFTKDHPFAAAFLEPIEPLVERDAVLQRSYEFDVSRYGDGELRDIAEEQFAQSTQLSLRLLGAAGGRDGFIRAWSARLIAALPAALAADPRQAREVLSRYRDATRYFLQSTNGHRDGHYLPFEEVANDMREAIEEAAGLRSAGGGASALLSDWRTRLARAAERIESASARQRAPQNVPDLLIDYVHMTNNRLGLSVSDEAYLVSMLQLAFEGSMR